MLLQTTQVNKQIKTHAASNSPQNSYTTLLQIDGSGIIDHIFIHSIQTGGAFGADPHRYLDLRIKIDGTVIWERTLDIASSGNISYEEMLVPDNIHSNSYIVKVNAGAVTDVKEALCLPHDSSFLIEYRTTSNSTGAIYSTRAVVLHRPS